MFSLSHLVLLVSGSGFIEGTCWILLEGCELPPLQCAVRKGRLGLGVGGETRFLAVESFQTAMTLQRTSETREYSFWIRSRVIDQFCPLEASADSRGSAFSPVPLSVRRFPSSCPSHRLIFRLCALTLGHMVYSPDLPTRETLHETGFQMILEFEPGTTSKIRV